MQVFSLVTPHGALAGFRLPAEHSAERAHEHPELQPEEALRAVEFRGPRRTGFVAGRLAVARALSAVGAPRVAIGSDPRGAPVMPEGFVGSISHKGELGVGLASVDEGARLGVDVEVIKPLSAGVERLVLTASERSRLLRLPDEARARAVLASFSIKESIYKAIDPFVQRWVGYHEALVELPEITSEWSSVPVQLLLAKGESIGHIEAFVTERDGCFLSTAKAFLSGPRRT